MKKVMIIITAVLVVLLLIVLLFGLNTGLPGAPADGGAGGGSGGSSGGEAAPQPIVKDGYVTPALWRLPEKTTVDGQTIVPDTTKSLFSYRIGMYHGMWYGFIEADGQTTTGWTMDSDLFEVFEDGRIHHLVPGAAPDDAYKPMGVITTEKYDYLRYFYMYTDDEQHILHEATTEGYLFNFTPVNMGQSKYTRALSKVPYGTKLEIGIRDVDASMYFSLVERDIYVYCFGYLYEDRVLYEAGYAAGLADAKAGKAYTEQSNPVSKQGYNDGYAAGGKQVVYASGRLEVATATGTVTCDAGIYGYYKARGLQNGQADKAANATYDLTRGFDPSLPNRTDGYLAAYAEGYRNGYTGTEIDPACHFYLVNVNGSYEFTGNAALAGDPAGYSYHLEHDGLNFYWNTTDTFTVICPACKKALRFETTVNGSDVTIRTTEVYYAIGSSGGYYFSSMIPGMDAEYECEHDGVYLCWSSYDETFIASCPVCDKSFRFSTEADGKNLVGKMTEVSYYYLVRDEDSAYFVSEIPENFYDDSVYEIEHNGVIFRLNTTETVTARCPVCGLVYEFGNIHGDITMTEVGTSVSTECYLVANEMGEYSATDTRPDGVDYTCSVQHCGVTIWLPSDVPESFRFTCPVCGETILVVDGCIV